MHREQGGFTYWRRSVHREPVLTYWTPQVRPLPQGHLWLQHTALDGYGIMLFFIGLPWYARLILGAGKLSPPGADNRVQWAVPGPGSRRVRREGADSAGSLAAQKPPRVMLTSRMYRTEALKAPRFHATNGVAIFVNIAKVVQKHIQWHLV